MELHVNLTTGNKQHESTMNASPSCRRQCRTCARCTCSTFRHQLDLANQHKGLWGLLWVMGLFMGGHGASHGVMGDAVDTNNPA